MKRALVVIIRRWRARAAIVAWPVLTSKSDKPWHGLRYEIPGAKLMPSLGLIKVFTRCQAAASCLAIKRSARPPRLLPVVQPDPRDYTATLPLLSFLLFFFLLFLFSNSMHGTHARRRYQAKSFLESLECFLGRCFFHDDERTRFWVVRKSMKFFKVTFVLCPCGY